MDITYCGKKCLVGTKALTDFLNKNNSSYDAAMEFSAFTETCFKTCPFKNEHPTNLKVCCISAKARHGKDTAAELLKEYLEQQGQRVLITHFADLLKYICKQFFDWDGNKDEKGRTLLQEIGTDVVGAQNPAYWADFIVGILKMFENKWDYVLIPDCRYPVEIAALEDVFNTTVLRVERPNFESGLTEAQKKHPSEVDMDNYPFDTIIYNDGSLEEFAEKVKVFADSFLLKD